MAHHEHAHDDHGHLSGAEQRKQIWKVFFILFAITAVEFIIAFTIGRSSFRNWTFILMTLVKAGYIVAEFMHLRHEVKSLIMTILIPMVFILWLILALLIEGTFASPASGGWFPETGVVATP